MQVNSIASSSRRSAMLVLACSGISVLAIALGLAATAAKAAVLHTPLPSLTLTGTPSDPGPIHPPTAFNNPCGMATDANGNIYVASYFNDTIDVFNSTGEFLTEISAANGPCSLAVDSAGDVYAFQFNTGNVVEYSPSAYPPAVTTTYSGPTPINSSGSARSVAIDPANDHVYVDEGTQIAEYDSVAHGSGVLNSSIGAGTLGDSWGVDVYGANGDIYASDASGNVVYIFDPTGTIVLQAINGTGVPSSPGVSTTCTKPILR